MGLPRTTALLACLLVALVPRQARSSVEINRVYLDGSDDYLDVESRQSYTLTCDYRTPYDDPVKEVLWARFGRPFYKWTATGSPTVLDSTFLGMVDTSPELDSEKLHFKGPYDYSLAGSYMCQVFTANSSEEEPYELHVVDGGSWPVVMNLQVLSKVKEDEVVSNNSYITTVEDDYTDYVDPNDQNKYETDQTGEEEPDTEVEFEDEECTLVWSLSTPAIYPRPNVTCGHYSFDHEDVVKRLPAGLTMHKFPNGSWSASFDHTHVQVSSIPKNHRLGCSIRIPDTSYKKIIRPEDDLAVENLIDTGGCPGFEDAQEMGILVEVTDATYTCRGDVLPADRSGLAKASLSCPEGYTAIFPDDMGERSTWDGGLELTCSENDLGWRKYNSEEPGRVGDLVDPASLPVCVPGASGGEHTTGKLCSVTLAITLLLGWLLQT